MEKSETLNELAKALVNFQKDMPAIEKNATVDVKTRSGGSYSFKYATLDNIISSVKQKLADNGLSYSQLVGEGGSVTTILMHESGEYLADTCTITPISGEDGVTAQMVGSVITYTKRYQLAGILGLSTEDDDDANIAVGNTATKKERYANDTRPFLSDKQYNVVLERIRAKEYNFTDPSGETWNFETPEELFVALKNSFKIKNDWKTAIEQVISSPLNL